MRLIDADALMEYCNNLLDKTVDANDIARFPTAVGWISCEDRLPKEIGEYIVCNRGKVMTGVFCDEWVVPYRNPDITHWMPMPEGPKGVNTDATD